MEEILCCQCSEAMKQVAQRSCRCPKPGSVQKQAGWSSEQFILVEVVTPTARGLYLEIFKVSLNPSTFCVLNLMIGEKPNSMALSLSLPFILLFSILLTICFSNFEGQILDPLLIWKSVISESCMLLNANSWLWDDVLLHK